MQMRTKNTARRNPLPVDPVNEENVRASLRPKTFRTKAHKRFHDSQTIKRAFIPERPLLLENSIFDSLPNPPLARGWSGFARHPSRCCKKMVREFYANAMSLPKTEDLERYTSYVRGKVVRYDRETISTVLSLPDEVDDGFRCYFYRMLEGIYDRDDILATVSDGNDSWKMGTDRRPKSLKRRYLKPMAMELLNVILANIQPSMHCSEVTLERVFLVYVMLKGHDLDLARVLATEIHRSIMINRAITHPSLIYKLCIHAGVPDVIEEELRPGDMLGVRMLNRKRTRLASERESGDDMEDEINRQGATTSDSTQGYGPRILSALERIEGRMENIERRQTRLEKLGRFLKKQGAALMKLFKSKNKAPADSKGKGVAVPSDDDDDDLEVGDGGDFHLSSSDDGGDADDYFMAPFGDNNPYGGDFPDFSS